VQLSPSWCGQALTEKFIFREKKMHGTDDRNRQAKVSLPRHVQARVTLGSVLTAALLIAGCGSAGNEAAGPNAPSQAGAPPSAGGFPVTPAPVPTPPPVPTDGGATPAPTPAGTPAPTPVSGGGGGNPPAPPPADPASVFGKLAAQDKEAPTFDVSSPVIKAGLDIWVKPDKFGMACANCHGTPAALEFAFAGFSKENISRRGTFHFPQQDIDKIMAMVSELATLYKLPKNNPDTFRPLQPGGEPTVGATWQERDYNFLLSLKTYAPTLVNTKMETVEQARQAYKEIAAIDKSKMRIPTVSPVWSADGLRDKTIDSHHEWIASLPSLPVSEEGAKKIRDATMAYLAKPSNENFFNYYNAYRDNSALGTVVSAKEAQGADGGLTHNGYYIERAKPSAAAYVGHIEVQKALGLPQLSARGPYATVQTSGPKANFKDPVFIDAFTRMGDNTQQRLGGAAVLPADSIARMDPAILANFSEHLKFRNMDWWGLAFAYQPALQSVAATYWFDGWIAANEKEMELYPSFRLFSMASRGIARNSFGYKNQLVGPSQPQPFSMMHNSGTLAQTENPTFYFNAEHMKMHQAMALNVYKMRFLLMADAWETMAASGKKTDDVTEGRTSNNQWMDVDLVKSFAKRNMPDQVAGIDAIGRRLAQAAQLAYTGANVASVATSGTGLTMQAFDDANFTTPLGAPQVVPGVNITEATHPAADTFVKTPNPKLSPRRADVLAVPAGTLPGSSIVWSGRVAANYADEYQFIIPVGGKVALHDIRVTVDGKVVLAGGKFGNVGTDNFAPDNNGNEGYHSIAVSFAAGQSRTIKVEHSNDTDVPQFAVLKWQGKTTTPHWLIQSSNLYPQ
jgi:hypothetical protein